MRFGRRYPPRWGSPHPAIRVLRTGEPLLFPELSDERHSSDHCGRGAPRLVRALGRAELHVHTARGAWANARRAQPRLGHAGRRYGRADLELAVELGRRAANAIDNARLYRASQQALSARNEFLTVASHELKTPLTSLTLSMEALHRAAHSGRPIDPQLLDQRIERISHQGTRLTRLVGDLLDVSRARCGPAPAGAHGRRPRRTRPRSRRTLRARPCARPLLGVNPDRRAGRRQVGSNPVSIGS